MTKLQVNNYEFSRSENFDEVYPIARSQFAEVISNFNESEFFEDFSELFYGGDNYYKLFMKKRGRIICGTLSWLFGKDGFCDIVFWNEGFFKKTDQEFRFFCEEAFKQTGEMGIENLILPLNRSRKRYESFKRYLERFYCSKEQHICANQRVAQEYEGEYLLKVNFENYFNERQISTNENH